MLNLLGRCFQEDFFELDLAALPNDIFIWQVARSNSYQPLDIFELSIYQGGNKEYLYIFDSMLRIFIMQSNRQQSICDNIKKILSLMTKICMVFFGVFVCFAGIELKTGEGVFIKALECCEPHKLLVQCGPYKRILC